jgi:hypothetical protein
MVCAAHRRSSRKEPTLRTQFAYLIAGLMLAMTQPSFAQSNDAKYCAELVEKYEQYVSEGAEKGASQSPLEVEIAKGKCRSSPASSIPVMEKALKNARVALPPRG